MPPPSRSFRDPFPPLEAFLYPPGPLEGNGGWILGGTGSPGIILLGESNVTSNDDDTYGQCDRPLRQATTPYLDDAWEYTFQFAVTEEVGAIEANLQWWIRNGIIGTTNVLSLNPANPGNISYDMWNATITGDFAYTPGFDHVFRVWHDGAGLISFSVDGVLQGTSAGMPSHTKPASCRLALRRGGYTTRLSYLTIEPL